LFKGKNCIGSGKNGKLAPIAIGVELRSQLWDWARRSGEDWGGTLRATEKFCSGRHTLFFFWYSTCDDNPQIRAYQKKDTSQHRGLRAGARPQFPANSESSAKNQKLTWQIWNLLWGFYKAEATKLYSNTLTK
jgi:hypothetical protein